MCKETRCIFAPILTYGLTFLMSAKIVSAWVKKANHAENKKKLNLHTKYFFFFMICFFYLGQTLCIHKKIMQEVCEPFHRSWPSVCPLIFLGYFLENNSQV